MGKMLLYHGSDMIVKKPMFGVGKEDNDYGSGFYTTEDIDKAREWALTNGAGKAICNMYEIDTAGLTVLNLDDFGILAWITEIISHRGSKIYITDEIGQRLVEKYKVDTSNADIIIGYRADDSYITIVEAFLKNELSVDEVDRLFRKGDLGQQVFIKSPKAFESLVFTGYEEVNPLQRDALGNADAQARHDVISYLNKREMAIQMQGFVPAGITARAACNDNFEYNKEYACYLQVTEDERTAHEPAADAGEGDNYEPEF